MRRVTAACFRRAWPKADVLLGRTKANEETKKRVPKSVSLSAYVCILRIGSAEAGGFSGHDPQQSTAVNGGRLRPRQNPLGAWRGLFLRRCRSSQ